MSQAAPMNSFGVNDILLGGAGLTAAALALWRMLSGTRASVKRDGAEGKVIDSVFKDRDAKATELDRSQERERITSDLLRAEQKIVLQLRGDLIEANGRINVLEERLEGQGRALAHLATLLVQTRPDAKPWVAQWLAESGYPPLDMLPAPPAAPRP